MNILAVIIAIVIFPLNFLLLFPGDLDFSKVQEEKSIETIGEVQGTESSKEGSLVNESKIVPEPVQPTRLEESYDLTVPTAHASLILDVDSGTILHYEKGSERRQIASLTKLMTAVLVMEKVNNLSEEVMVDEDAVYEEGTKIGCPRSGYCISPRLKVGEKISVLSLMKGLLMNSANDAAVALAKHVSGTEEEFVNLMNNKAEELGLKDTHFCTASGLEIDGREHECYSTAYDIARIAAYSMKYETIWKIFRLPNNTRIFSADGKYYHDIMNTDIVMDQIPNCLGGKTGFTPLAGRSLLVAATDPTNEHEVVAVLLDDPYRWQSVKEMISWAFESYEWE